MKGFLIFLVVAVIAVGGFGLYRGWWSVSSEKGADNKTHIDITVNKDKFSEDGKAALKKVEAVEQKVKDKVAGTKEKADSATSQAATAAHKEEKEAGIVPAVLPPTQK